MPASASVAQTGEANANPISNPNSIANQPSPSYATTLPAVPNAQPLELRVSLVDPAAAASANGTFSLSVQNHGRTSVRLADAFLLERLPQAHAASDTPALMMSFVGACAQPAECVELSAGAELLPAAFETGPKNPDPRAAPNCHCAACPGLPSGTYRFVVSSCDGRARSVSEPFEFTQPAR